MTLGCGGIMKKSFKCFLSLFLLNLVLMGSVFAEGYHVCVASYQKLANAQEMVQKLEKQSISAIISESKSKNQTLYRVLLAKEFKKIEDARKYRDEVQKYSFGKTLNLKDFWVCKSEKIVSKSSSAPVAKPAPAPKKVTQPKPAPKKETPKPQPKNAEPKPEPISEPAVKNVEVEPEPLPEPEPIPEVPAPAKNVEPAPEPAPVIIVPKEEPISLEKNEKAVLSEKTPYSVLVRSYKFNQFAENDCNRLKELGFDAYLLNTFDEKSFFAFNIHVGAFETREEAEIVKNQFADAGIPGTEVSDYNEIKPSIEKYDEIISTKKVTFNDGRSDLPSSIPTPVEKLVKQFPVNKDFPIQEVTILDYDNYLACVEKPELNSSILNEIIGKESVYSALQATYRDELYRKQVNAFLLNAESFAFEENGKEPIEKLQLGSGNGTFDSELYQNGTEFVLCGKNESEKVFVRLSTKDFSKEEFVEFLIDSFNDSDLSLYPQLRRTFFVLPNATGTPRDFVYFNFKKVGDDYASERGYVDWSLPIVGHSLAKAFYTEKNSLLCFGFYDLDYDFNAETVHAHFMNAKNATDVSDSNQPVLVNGVDGWYLVNSTQKEISFSTKSYVIAIDTDPASSLLKDDLVRSAFDLRIWDGNNIIDAK